MLYFTPKGLEDSFELLSLFTSPRSLVMMQLLGEDLAKSIKIFAGDVVPKKKPDPAIYNLAAEDLKVDPAK